MKHTKRPLSLLLTLCLLLGLLPTTVWASYMVQITQQPTAENNYTVEAKYGANILTEGFQWWKKISVPETYNLVESNPAEDELGVASVYYGEGSYIDGHWAAKRDTLSAAPVFRVSIKYITSPGDQVTVRIPPEMANDTLTVENSSGDSFQKMGDGVYTATFDDDGGIWIESSSEFTAVITVNRCWTAMEGETNPSLNTRDLGKYYCAVNHESGDLMSKIVTLVSPEDQPTVDWLADPNIHMLALGPVEVTQDNYDDIFRGVPENVASGKASFAVVNGTPTLTLDGVTVEEGYEADGIRIGLLCSDELTIVLADGSDNNITISGEYAMGIMIGDMSYFSPLTVTGTGTLTVSASASGMLCFGGYVGGIQVTGGAEFTVTASTPVAQAECIGLNIDVGGNLQVSDGGVVRISGTTAAVAFGDDTVQILADGYSIQGSTTANDFTNLADAELKKLKEDGDVFTLKVGDEIAKSVVIAPAHSHTWAGAWTTDATHHWHKCTADGCPVTDDTQKDGYALHSGGTATCTAKAVCDACAIPYGELAAHDFTGDYLSDADGHWHKCKTCTATDTKAAHTYDDDQDTTCNTCGYTRTITPSHTHTWAGAWTTNETHHWHECTAPGCPVTDPAQKDDYAVHEEDSGTVTKPVTETETGVKTFKCTVCGRVLRTEDIPIPTYSISGLVEDKDGAAVSGAAVTLMRGSRQIGQTTTDPSGRYTFPNVPVGTYNVVAEQGTGDDKITKTILVVLTDSNATSQNIKMPDGKKNSVVEVKSGAPDVVVGGVDQVAEAQDVGSGQTVTIKLTVEKKEENTATGAADIKQLAGGKTVDFLELSLVKEVTGGTNDGITSITDTLDNVLEIVVPYDFSGKNAVTVYRHHDGKAQALTPADTNAKGTFRLDETGGLIYIYATKFSTYAIGYTPSGVTPPTPPSGGSDSPDTYTPIIEKSGHGKVECRPRSPERGEKVTLTLTPDKGWQLGSLTVTDRNGKPVVVTRRGDGIYTFTQPTGKATIKAVFQPISVTPSSCLRDSTCPIWPFQDSDPGAWYHDGVHYCIEKEWMVGSDSHTFSPDGHMSRAMIASILWRMEGRPVVNYILPFDDVAQSAWHAEAVRWAAANGVAGGYGDGCFGPDDPITREQLSLMLWRYAGSPTPAEELKAFSDAHTAGDWARDALCWAVEKGILTGRGDGVLDPGGNATRAEAAVMLLRYSQRGQ